MSTDSFKLFAFDLILYVQVNNFQLYQDDLPGLNQYQARINVFCSRTQHTGEVFSFASLFKVGTALGGKN